MLKQNEKYPTSYFVGGYHKTKDIPYKHLNMWIPLAEVEEMVRITKEKGLTGVKLMASKKDVPFEKDGEIIATHGLVFDVWSKPSQVGGTTASTAQNPQTDDLPF